MKLKSILLSIATTLTFSLSANAAVTGTSIMDVNPFNAGVQILALPKGTCNLLLAIQSDNFNSQFRSGTFVPHIDMVTPFDEISTQHRCVVTNGYINGTPTGDRFQRQTHLRCIATVPVTDEAPFMMFRAATVTRPDSGESLDISDPTKYKVVETESRAGNNYSRLSVSYSCE